MALAQALALHPWLFVTAAALLGLVVGSFLNVVIHRLPIMLERSWQGQCRELLELEAQDQPAPFNLVVPRSRCPRCGHQIRAWENIPVLSFLFQRGRCRGCDERISWRYPAVEILTALLSAVAAWHFGFGWPAMAALLLTWVLVVLSFIDLDTQLLPDDITLPFLWLGILIAFGGLFTTLEGAVIGAIAGYLSLWSVYQLFRLSTGKEGMGFGDFKLLAMLGAWLGWQMLPAIILLSAVVGAVVGLTMIAFRGHDRSIPIPFGPYLAAAGWIAMLWGEAITRGYLDWAAGG